MSIPRIRLETVEAIARKILMEYDSSLLSGEPRPIPIEATVIAAPITTKKKPSIPTHVCLERQVGKLRCGSVILVEQIRTIDKSRLTNRIGALNDLELQKVNHALEISVGLLPVYSTV